MAISKTFSPRGRGYTLGMTVIEAILAVVLPPVAVAMKKGIKRPFWIDVLLTLLGHIPGVVYALMVVTGKD